MKKNIYLLLVLVLSAVLPANADTWTYDFEDFGTVTGNNGPKAALDVTLNGLQWHAYGVRSNATDDDWKDGDGSMRIYGEVSSSTSRPAAETPNFTLAEARSIGTFSFTIAQNSYWQDMQVKWIVQYSTDNATWTTVGDEFEAPAEPMVISRTINAESAYVRIVRADYQTYDYTSGSGYNYIANIDNMIITDNGGTSSAVLKASVTDLAFGDVIKDEAETKTITVTHSGLDDAVTYSLVGTDPDQFNYTTTALNDSVDELSVQFTPSRRGNFSARLRAKSGIFSVEVALTGRGVLPEGQLFSGGTGTEDDPYLISTPEDLVDLSTEVDENLRTFEGEYFRVTNDINMINVNNFLPIGNNIGRSADDENYIRPFSGTFDGQNFTISGITGAWTTYSFVGLFGIVKGATINNVNLDNCMIYGYNGTAALVGAAMDGCTISNCHIGKDVKVNGGQFYTAGICAGTLTGSASLIEDCTNAGTITGVGGFSAGILSRNAQHGTRILRCGNTGEVTDENLSVGGIVANSGSTTIVRDCYNTGYISTANLSEADNSYAGSIVGCTDGMLADDSVYIYNCYSTNKYDVLTFSQNPIFDAGMLYYETFLIDNCYYSKDYNNYDYDFLLNVSSDVMHTAEFAKMLNNSADGSGVWMWEANENDGLPFPGNTSYADGISSAQAAGTASTTAVYDLSGRRLPQSPKHGIAIERTMENGKTVVRKVLK